MIDSQAEAAQEQRDSDPRDSRSNRLWRWAMVAGALLLGYLAVAIFRGEPERDAHDWVGSNLGGPLARELHGRAESLASHPDHTGWFVVLVVALSGALAWQSLMSRRRLMAALRERTDELHRSEERYVRIFQASAQGVLVVRREDLSVVEANRVACRLLGCSREGILGRSLADFPSSEWVRGGASQGSDADGPVREIHRLSALDGRAFPAEMEWATIRWAGKDHHLLSFQDITQRVEAEETIRKLSIALEQSPLATVITDVGANIEYVNPAFTANTGYALEEIKGRNPRILKSGKTPKSVYEDLWRTLLAGRNWRGEFLNHRRNGELFTELATIAPIRQEGGRVVGYVAIKEDVTEKRAAEEMLKQAKFLAENANAAKREFLANMSHEIRTPLNGVISMVGLLLETELTEDQKRFAGIVRTSSETLLSLVNDILDFSKIEAGKLDLDLIDFDLAALFDDVASILAHRAQAKGLEFICSVDPKVPCHLHGDPGRLRQILLNLAGNAIKFTSSGEVVVAASLEEDSASWVRVRFQVRDSGIGIPPHKRDLLFQEFSQLDPSIARNYGGTGLGLAISKQLVEKMSGEIGVESPWVSPLDNSTRQGSQFWFTARLSRQTRENVRPILPAGIQGTRILVVDDNATNCAVLVEQLRSWDARPDFVYNGEDALAFLRRASEASDPYRVAVLDMKMSGMDGVALAREIKSDPGLSCLPLVLMTSMANRGDGRRMQDAGFAGYLPKPARKSDLLDILKLVLGASRIPEPVAMITRHTARETRRSTARILMAEDNHTNQIVAGEILRKLGLAADMVGDGLQALTALENTPYDLVLMDMQMPGLDGIQATLRIRDPGSAVIDHAVPVVAMTANAMEDDRRRCLDAGMNDYLAKPFSPRELSEILDRWLPADKRFLREVPTEVPPGASREFPADAVFDRQALVSRVLGDEGFAREVREAFREDVLLQIQQLEALLERADVPASRRTIHTIRGAAMGVGGREMGLVAERLEESVEEGDLRPLREGLGELVDCFHRLVQAMERDL